MIKNLVHDAVALVAYIIFSLEKLFWDIMMLWSLSDRLRTRNYMEMLKSGARKLIQMTKNFGVKNDLNEKNIYIVFGAATYTVHSFIGTMTAISR